MLLAALMTLSTVFLPGLAWANTEVSATVDRNAMSPQDTLVFTINIDSGDEIDAGEPTLPNLTDFEVLNRWTSQEARAMFVTTPKGPQFKTVRSSKYNYMLQPRREGQLTIGAAEVVVDGKAFRTKPITVRVGQGLGGGVAQPRGAPPAGIVPPPGFGDDEEDDLFSQLLRRHMPPSGGSRTLPINPNEAFFVQVETDKTDVFVNEQVTVSWYLYTRGQIRDLDTLKYPALKGFWKEDIEIATHLNFTQEVVNGIPYKKALLASFALFPIKDGKSEIDSYTAKCSVITADDPFGAFGNSKVYTFTKSSQPVKINVRPLPSEGRPADFTGAVGDFQVSTRVDDRNIVAHQPFTFRVRFEGQGNAKLIEIPPFQVPDGMELYETQNDAKFFRTGTSYKEFQILLIPRRDGEFVLPPISASIFDPKQKKYVTKTTEPVRIRVNPGQAPTSDKSQSLSIEGESKKEKKPAVPFEPRLDMEWRSGSKVTSAQEVAGYALGFGLVGLTLLWRARVEFGWGQKKKDLTRRLKARMKRVHQLIDKGDWRAVGVEMTNAVYFILGEISGEGGANVELEKLLLKAPPSVRRELAEPLQKQMEVFQILSFAPEAAVGKLKEPAELKRVVGEMEALIEKAVALGLDSYGRSFGQSDGSESGPKAS
jgi:hypothetical protein